MLWLYALAGFLAWPLLFWVLLPGLGIVRRAIRDTVKWRTRHLKSGYGAWWLVLYYPVLFWDNLRDQWGSYWLGTESESSPCER